MPQMKYDLEENAIEIFEQGWPRIKSVIFDLRPEEFYQYHTNYIPFRSFNTKDKLWGGIDAAPQLIYCTETSEATKFRGSVHMIKHAN